MGSAPSQSGATITANTAQQQSRAAAAAAHVKAAPNNGQRIPAPIQRKKSGADEKGGASGAPCEQRLDVLPCHKRKQRKKQRKQHIASARKYRKFPFARIHSAAKAAVKRLRNHCKHQQPHQIAAHAFGVAIALRQKKAENRQRHFAGGAQRNADRRAVIQKGICKMIKQHTGIRNPFQPGGR